MSAHVCAENRGHGSRVYMLTLNSRYQNVYSGSSAEWFGLMGNLISNLKGQEQEEEKKPLLSG